MRIKDGDPVRTGNCSYKCIGDIDLCQSLRIPCKPPVKRRMIWRKNRRHDKDPASVAKNVADFAKIALQSREQQHPVALQYAEGMQVVYAYLHYGNVGYDRYVMLELQQELRCRCPSMGKVCDKGISARQPNAPA